MDIYTDASLNDVHKIAGIGMVFVPNRNQSKGVIRLNTHVWADKVETAELFAIAIALGKLHPQNTDDVRIITDSDRALKEILNIFQYAMPDRIKHVKDLVQQKILYHISACFAKMKNVKFSFQLIRGHQTKAQPLSDGYYNMLADEEARLGREEGEETRVKEIRLGNSPASFFTSEENMILNQKEAPLFFPSISFSFKSGKALGNKNPDTKLLEEKGFSRRKPRSGR